MCTILDALSRLRRYYIGKKAFSSQKMALPYSWRDWIIFLLDHHFYPPSQIPRFKMMHQCGIFPFDYFYFVSSDEVGRCLSLYILYLSISGEKNISAWQEERCGMTDYVLYILYFYSDANLRHRHHCTLVGCRSPYHHICFHLQVNNEFFFKSIAHIFAYCWLNYFDSVSFDEFQYLPPNHYPFVDSTLFRINIFFFTSFTDMPLVSEGSLWLIYFIDWPWHQLSLLSNASGANFNREKLNFVNVIGSKEKRAGGARISQPMTS